MFPNNSIGQVSTGTIVEISPQVQVLIGKLFSRIERERVNAALKLANYNNPMVVNSLISVIERDSSEMVKRVAITSLGYIGSFLSLPIILETITLGSLGLKVEAMGAAVNFSSPKVAEAIIKETNSKNPIVRQNAVACLGKLKNVDKKINNVIVEKLNDISDSVRVTACRIIGQKKITMAIQKLEQIIEDDNSDIVRESAVCALGDIASKDTEYILKKALLDASPEVRIIAAKGLAGIDSAAGLGEAIEGIKSSNAKIRVIACEVIGTVGQKDAYIFLKQAASDIDKRVQRAATLSLDKLEKRK